MHGLRPYPPAGTDDYLATLVVQTATLARLRGARYLQLLLEMAAHEAIRVAEGQEPRGGATSREDALNALEQYLRYSRGQEPFLVAAVPDEALERRHQEAADAIYGYDDRERARVAMRPPSAV